MIERDEDAAPMNERAVRAAFRTAVERYCNLANAAGLPTRGLRVGVTVTTARLLSAASVARINQIANDHVFQMLPGALVASIVFPVTAGLPEPGYRFDFSPPDSARLTVPEPAPAPELPAEPVAILTLRYGPDFTWRCRIGAARGWLALGRWTERPAGSGVIQLPTYATALPRGGLLLVRNRSGGFAFGRSPQRPQYELRVDGVTVPPGDAVPALARAEGSLEYRHDVSSTLLAYRVDWEGHDA
jgi:hypothetical protein